MSLSVYIAAPSERVWMLIDDANHWSQWSGVVEQVWKAPGYLDWQPGIKFGFRLLMARKKVPFNVTVTRYEPGKLIQWRSTKFSITAVRSISVEPDGTGCRVVDQKYFFSSVLPIRLAYPRRLIRVMTERGLGDIKNSAEMFP